MTRTLDISPATKAIRELQESLKQAGSVMTLAADAMANHTYDIQRFLFTAQHDRPKEIGDFLDEKGLAHAEELMFSMQIKFNQPVHPEAKISIRAVANIDLAANGGYALLGDFVTNYKGGTSLSASSNQPLVFMYSVPLGPRDTARLAVLAVPRNTPRGFNLPLIPGVSIKSDEQKLTADVDVGNEGCIVAAYVNNHREAAAPLNLPPAESSNVYYQVALDLMAMADAGMVGFHKLPEAFLRHNANESVHAGLPHLPTGYKWGPEIAGINTVIKNDDPYTLLMPFEIANSLDSMRDSDKKILLKFLEDQAERIGRISKTVSQVVRVYR